MMTATDTRKKAREALTGKWGKGAVIALIYAVFTFILNSISGRMQQESLIAMIINIAIVIVEIPIDYGLIITFIKLKRGEELGYFDFLKDGFNNFGRSWGIIGNTLLKMIVPILLVFLSVILMGSSLAFSTTGVVSGVSSGSSSYLVLVGFLIYFIAIIYSIVRGLLYSISNYIAYDNPEMSTKEAVEESARLMNGNRGNIFVLELSFIGWVILSMFTLFIGLFWVFPYMQVALVCFYEQLVGKDDSSQEVVSSSKE